MADTFCTSRDFTFATPGEWIDRSVIVRSAPPTAAAVPPNVVAAYDRLQPGQSVADYVARQVADLARATRDFRLHGQGEAQLDGRPVTEVVFSWAAGPGPMKQRQLFAALSDNRVMSLACTAPEADFEQFAPLFGQVLSTFRWS